VKQELKDLAKHRLERAENTLLDAQKYFKNATLSSTVNRIYYAMFYAVNGLLIAKGLSSSKNLFQPGDTLLFYHTVHFSEFIT